MTALPALAWIGSSTILGPERAFNGLMAHLILGKPSDTWAGEFLETTPDEDYFVPPFAETLKRWKAREILTSARFDALADEIKGQAGRLVGAWHTGFVQKVYESLFDAIANGETLVEWAEAAQSLLDQYGASDAVRIFSGARWSPRYADLVFRNANAAATAGGRYAEMFSREWIEQSPWWLYDAVGDNRTRPAHLALDGMVFRKDDAAARRLLPPTDFNCRCIAIEHNYADLEKGKYRVTSSAGLSPDVFPPRGWDADRVESLVPLTLRGGDLSPKEDVN